MEGLLALEDGTILRGRGFGAVGWVAAEMCFNTSMTGYQEILTDPSYRGQVVALTCPEIGNTGINPCLLYTSPSPRDRTRSRMPSSA